MHFPATLTRLAQPLAIVCGLLAGAAASGSELADAYRAFRAHFDAGRYEEALPSAQQVVQLSEQKYGPEQMELVMPLTNLGTTQLRLQSYFEAEASFRRALEVVEAREGGVSSGAIRPLLGLGATYAAAGQHAEAANQLRRAVDVSRKIEGLFNPEQVQILEPLIASYMALEQEEDAERERDYAIRIAESTYGKDDIRVVPALLRGAHWYEEAERYVGARNLYSRALVTIARHVYAQKKSKEISDIRMVEPLRGIARTYRLEYLYGGKVWTEEQRNEEIPVITQTPTVGRQSINDEGRRALQRALEILKETPDTTATQRGAVLLELGDYHLSADNENKAFEAYKQAWSELSAAGAPGTAQMQSPVQIVYAPPTGARRQPPALSEEFDRSYVEVQFTVMASGKTDDLEVISADATDKRQRSVVEALRKARYRPAFSAGEPVRTEALTFRQDLYFKKKD